MGRPMNGISTPASSGPAIAPACTTVMFSALAAGSSAAGSSRGSTALRVGWLTARNAVCTENSTSTVQTPPMPLVAVTQRASELTAMPAPVTSSSTRRSTASAMAPPHSPNTISGTRPNSPVSPTQAEEPVSW